MLPFQLFYSFIYFLSFVRLTVGLTFPPRVASDALCVKAHFLLKNRNLSGASLQP